METLGHRIKYLRKSINLTQPELAQLMQVSNAVISFWENDINEPKANYIIKLSKIFKVSTDYILGNEEEDGRIIVQELELPSDERQLIENYRNLPDDLKISCVEYVKTMNNLNKEYKSKNIKFS